MNQLNLAKRPEDINQLNLAKRPEDMNQLNLAKRLGIEPIKSS